MLFAKGFKFYSYIIRGLNTPCCMPIPRAELRLAIMPRLGTLWGYIPRQCLAFRVGGLPGLHGWGTSAISHRCTGPVGLWVCKSACVTATPVSDACFWQIFNEFMMFDQLYDICSRQAQTN